MGVVLNCKICAHLLCSNWKTKETAIHKYLLNAYYKQDSTLYFTYFILCLCLEDLLIKNKNPDLLS